MTHFRKGGQPERNLERNSSMQIKVFQGRKNIWATCGKHMMRRVRNLN